jgi:hypothetical protein
MILNGFSSSPNVGWEIKTGLLKVLRVIITNEERPKIRPKTKKPFFFIR